MIFRIIKNKSKDYRLELEGSDGCWEIRGKKKVPVWNIHVVCKWDGCTDYWNYNNGYSWNHECKDDCQCCEEYIHICSIDNMIEQLQTIKKMGIEYYKGKSGEEYWN